MIIKKTTSLQDLDYLGGVTMLVEKPPEWTSFDVVGKIRGLLRKKLQIKKIKVGHAGTLDPLATGLLIIAIGKDTQRIIDFQDLDKRYSGTMMLGATTPSADAESSPDHFFSTEHITAELIEETSKQFIGEITQIPPIYSAVKIDGLRAYKLAREGVDFQPKARQVFIYDFQIVSVRMPLVDFSVHCQKGTYIRSLARDMGVAMQSGAFLTSLCRTAIGNYHLTDAWRMDELVKQLE